MFGRKQKVELSPELLALIEQVFRQLDEIERDSKAAHGAIKAQVAAIHGELSKVLDEHRNAIREFNKRLSHERRPVPSRWDAR